MYQTLPEFMSKPIQWPEPTRTFTPVKIRASNPSSPSPSRVGLSPLKGPQRVTTVPSGRRLFRTCLYRK